MLLVAHTDVIVIGGGISGLAAAYQLACDGVPFQLLEASPRLGGLIKTEHVDDFTLDAGPDAVLAQKPAALALCRELGLGDRLIPTNLPRTAFVLSSGRLLPIPSPSVLGIPLTLRGLLGYELLSPAARLRAALEPWVPRRGKEMQDESVADFFSRRFGPATVPSIAEPLLGGIHAGRAAALSMHALFPRFVEAERSGGSVLRALRRTQQSPSADGAFRSLRSGMGELVSAIGRRLPPGCVRLAAPVATLHRDGEGWRAATPQGEVRARGLICAAPAYAAARLLASIDHDAARLCQGIEYVSSVSLALAYRRVHVAHPLAGSGYVVAHQPGRPRMTACTWVSSKWPGRAPEGTVLLRAFIGGAHDPSAVDVSDDELVALVSGELSALLGISAPPLFARVYRWRDSGAQHNVGHQDRMERLEQRLAHLPGLYVAGSGFRSVGIPDCVADGRSAGSTAARYLKSVTGA